MNPSTGISNVGAMSEFIGEFDVTSRLTDQNYHCRFSHLWNGVATRHSDTVDTKFVVNGQGVVVGLAHPGFVQFTARYGRDLSDREERAMSLLLIFASNSNRKMSARSMMYLLPM